MSSKSDGSSPLEPDPSYRSGSRGSPKSAQARSSSAVARSIAPDPRSAAMSAWDEAAATPVGAGVAFGGADWLPGADGVPVGDAVGETWGLQAARTSASRTGPVFRTAPRRRSGSRRRIAPLRYAASQGAPGPPDDGSAWGRRARCGLGRRPVDIPTDSTLRRERIDAPGTDTEGVASVA
jgi:hypothetical protein